MSKLTIVFPLAAAAFILLVFSEYVPLLRKAPAIPEDGRRMTARDRLLCLLLTALYALTSFSYLGDTQGIESFCKFGGRGEYALIEFREPISLGTVRYYHGLYMGEYYVELSKDGEFYNYAASLEARHKDVFKWNRIDLDDQWKTPVRYLRITASRPLWMGEIALYDDAGRLIGTDEMIIPDGSRRLFDEQEKIPAEASFLNSTYFDEIYHARTAYEHIENIYPYEISHPPLGKLLLGVGIRLFGMVPFGWRFSGTLFGVLMLPAIYLFLKKMLGGTLAPACGTAVLASDFLHFAQTRIATIDTYEVLFLILMYGFFWCYQTSDRTKKRSWLPPLAISGVCFGLGAASKWTGIYAGAGLAVLWVLDRVQRWRALSRNKKQRPAAVREFWSNAAWCLLFFVAVPALIYYVSYWYYGTSLGMDGGIGMLFSKEYLKTVLANQKYMFNYHSGVHTTHPYSSVWWQWLLDIRPQLLRRVAQPHALLGRPARDALHGVSCVCKARPDGALYPDRLPRAAGPVALRHARGL